MAQRAAAAVMQYSQHAGPAGRAQSCQVDSEPGAAGRIGGDEPMDDSVIARMQAPQFLHRFALPGALAVAETDAAGMQHEGIERVQVAPAGLGGATAEIVFLAVALAEVLHVEQPDRVQAVPADVHAKPNTGGHVHHLSGVRRGE